MTTDQTPPGADPGTPVGRHSRRRALCLLGSGAVAGTAALAGCTGPQAPRGPSGSAKSGTVKVWMAAENTDGQKFYTAQFKKLSESSDVTVEPQFFPVDQFANAMQLAFSGGNDLPDVFKIHGAQQITASHLHGRGWIQPIDEFITDEFTKRFPDDVYDKEKSPGYIAGHWWGVPHVDPSVNSVRVHLSNLGVLKKFGFDRPPETWSEFSEMASKISNDGQRKVYGTAMMGTNVGATTAILRSLAGPQPYREDQQPPISMKTGKPAMSEQHTLDMIKFFKDLESNRVLSPGWKSWKAAVLLQQFASERLAMYTFPIFHVAQLRKANKNLDLAITMPPVPDDGQKAATGKATDLMASWLMSSKASGKEAAWRVLDFIGSVEFQAAAYTELNDHSIMPQVYDRVDVNVDTKAIREIAGKAVRQQPLPGVRNPKCDLAYDAILKKAPKPPPFDLWFQGITTGAKVDDLAAKYDADLQKVMDAEFASAGVTAKDFVFDDWDPMQDYTTKPA